MQEYELEVPEDLLYFRGHFSGEPILAAVVQLQLAILPRVAQCWTDLARLRRLSRMKFRTPIRPGARLRLTLWRDPGLPRVDFTLHSGDRVCTSGTLEFSEEAPP